LPPGRPSFGGVGLLLHGNGHEMFVDGWLGIITFVLLSVVRG
jgi:hypothetical protein